MGPDPAVLGLFESEGEGVEHLRSAEPHEAVGTDIDIDPEGLGLGIAEARIDAVGRNHQIKIVPARVGRVALAVEVKLGAKLDRARSEDFEQSLAANADEAMARRGDRLPMDMDVDIVPMREFGGDGRGRDGVVGHEVVERLVGKHDSPAEGNSGGIAFEDVDLVGGVAKLHRNGEIESRGTAADASDLHDRESTARMKAPRIMLKACGASRLDKWPAPSMSS